MPAPMLYSTNPYFAIEVARKYRGGRFYAWCSESFDTHAAKTPTNMAASSDPKTIYEQLRLATATEDRHDQRIRGYKRTFKALANVWWANGTITDVERDEIRGACLRGPWRLWRPFLYVMPRALVDNGRLRLVPVAQRASHGLEYIVDGVTEDEMDIIELPRFS